MSVPSLHNVSWFLRSSAFLYRDPRIQIQFPKNVEFVEGTEQNSLRLAWMKKSILEEKKKFTMQSHSRGHNSVVEPSILLWARNVPGEAMERATHKTGLIVAILHEVCPLPICTPLYLYFISTMRGKDQFHSAQYQNHNFKNHKKVSFNIASEASYVYNLRGQKLF